MRMYSGDAVVVEAAMRNIRAETETENLLILKPECSPNKRNKHLMFYYASAFLVVLLSIGAYEKIRKW